MTLYRPMRGDSEGLPRVERKRWGLGPRITGLKPDLYVSPEGEVAPLGGGISVARDWQDILPDLLPVDFGGTNTTETMFALAEDAIPDDLNVRRSGPRKGHYVLEPRRKMPIEGYEALLAGTQAMWDRIEP